MPYLHLCDMPLPSESVLGWFFWWYFSSFSIPTVGFWRIHYPLKRDVCVFFCKKKTCCFWSDQTTIDLVKLPGFTSRHLCFTPSNSGKWCSDALVRKSLNLKTQAVILVEFRANILVCSNRSSWICFSMIPRSGWLDVVLEKTPPKFNGTEKCMPWNRII